MPLFFCTRKWLAGCDLPWLEKNWSHKHKMGFQAELNTQLHGLCFDSRKGDHDCCKKVQKKDTACKKSSSKAKNVLRRPVTGKWMYCAGYWWWNSSVQTICLKFYVYSFKAFWCYKHIPVGAISEVQTWQSFRKNTTCEI